MSNFWVGRCFYQKRTTYNRIGSLNQDEIGQGQVSKSKNDPKNQTSFMDGPLVVLSETGNFRQIEGGKISVHQQIAQ